MRAIKSKLKFFRESIQFKIFVVFSLVILLALSAIGAIIYIHMANSIKQNAIFYLKESIRHADESLSVILKDVEQIGTVIVTDESNVIDIIQSENYEISNEWYLEWKQIKAFISSLIKYKSSISRISIVGLNGKVFYEGLPYLDKTNINHSVLERTLSLAGKKVYIKQSMEEVGWKDTVTFGRAIYHGSKMIGAVMIDIKYEVIEQAYAITPLEDSLIVVVDSNGEYVYASSPTTLNQEEVVQMKQAANHVGDKKINGVKHLIVSYDSEMTGWSTIAMIPEYALFNDSILLGRHIVQAVLLVFVIVLIVSIAVTHRLTKNLRKLRNTMLWVKDGNLSVMNTINSTDEVGQLSRVFQDMLGQLKSLMENIKTGEKEKREAELTILQAQIRPHFIYNTLNTIKYLAKLRNASNIEEVSASLIRLLRGVLGNTKQFVAIEEELAYVQSFVDIQRYKYIEPFDVYIQAEPELMKCMIPKLLIQPIVENAIIHGIGPLKKNGIVTIKVQREDRNIRIAVTDNGYGISESDIERLLHSKEKAGRTGLNGIGISNVNERIHMVYGEDSGLRIDSEVGLYTTVEILIPYMERKKGTYEQSVAGR